MEFAQHLPVEARTQFERFFQRHQQQSDVIETTFHAIRNKDADGFRDGLVNLHPGEEERMVAVVFLSKLADKIHILKDPEVQKLSVEERIGAISAHRLNFHLYEDFARRFSAEDAESLWERFSTLYQKIEAEIARSVPDRTSRVMRYQLTEMPANFEVEDFIQSW